MSNFKELQNGNVVTQAKYFLWIFCIITILAALGIALGWFNMPQY